MRVFVKGQDSIYADKSISWGQEYNFKDYDVSFIDLRKLELRSTEFDHPKSDGEQKPKLPSYEDITEFYKTGGKMVVRLPRKKEVEMGSSNPVRKKQLQMMNQTAKEHSNTAPFDDVEKESRKYDLLSWFPFSVETREDESGVSLSYVDSEWDWYFGDNFNWGRLIESIGDWDVNSSKTTAIAKNRYEKHIATKVKHSGRYSSSGEICLIPRSTRISFNDFVKKVLSNTYDVDLEVEQSNAPEWTADYYFGDEKEIEEKIRKTKEELSGLQSDLEEKQRYKKLLYESGTALEEIVRETLEELGLEVEDEVPGRRDGLVKFDNVNVVLEIYGTGGGVKLSKARQLDEWVEEVQAENTDRNVTGLLIVNPHQETDPENRETEIEPNVRRYMDRRGEYKVLFTHHLFDILQMYRNDTFTVEEIKEAIINQNPLVEIGRTGEKG